MSFRSFTQPRLVAARARRTLAPAQRRPAATTSWRARSSRCGTFADVPPFAAPDPKTREMVGFDVDLCNAIAKRWA